MDFEKKLKKLAEKNGLTFKQCSEYHYQLKGVLLLNIYPTKNTVYIQGTNHKTKFHGEDKLVSLALGKGKLQGVEPTFDRPKKSKNKREYLWNIGCRTCFVCGKKFENFGETTLEHKVPLRQGGSNRKDNLSLSHYECNQLKANSLIGAIQKP